MTKRVPHIIYIALLATLLMAITGCEKSEYYDETEELEQTDTKGGSKGSSKDDGDEPDANEYNGGSESGGDDSGSEDDGTNNHSSTSTSDTLTVAQFISGEYSGGAFVKGYIIGDCTKNFKYAEFASPFTHPQALLLADDPNERNQEDILAVELKSAKYRQALNLVDHPDYHNRVVVLFGYCERYLYMNGLRSLGYYELK